MNISGGVNRDVKMCVQKCLATLTIGRQLANLLFALYFAFQTAQVNAMATCSSYCVATTQVQIIMIL